MLGNQCLVLDFKLILALRDLVGSDTKLTLQFLNLILSLNQVFGVKVTIRSYCLVEIHLLLELCFELYVFLLQFAD